MSFFKSILISILYLLFVADVSNAIMCVKLKNISAGEFHTLALADDNTLWSCGDNGLYQLGLGADVFYTYSLQQVKGKNGIGFLGNIVSFDAGWKHSLAADACGVVWACGTNSVGQLGNGQGVQYLDFPREVNGIGGNGQLTNIVYVSAGRSGTHSLAVCSDGNVFAWGNNGNGQCGDGNSGSQYNKYWPVKVLDSNNQTTNRYLGDETKIIKADAGMYHSIALDINGHVYHWGQDSSYNRTYPVKVKEPNGAILSNIIQITTCDFSLGVDSFGNVWEWWDSQNAYKVTGLTNIAEASAGHGYAMARTTDEYVLVWYTDRSYGDYDLEYVPAGDMLTQSGLLENIISINAGYYNQKMAISEDGFGWACGRDTGSSSGQLGVGDTEQHLDPVQMLCANESNSIYLTKTHDINGTEPNCAKPFIGNNYLVFHLCFGNSVTIPSDPNFFGTLYDFNIIEHLPIEVNYYSCSNGGQYDSGSRIVKWHINQLNPGDSNCYTVTTTVNRYAQPGGEIVNLAEMSNNEYYFYTTDTVPVCSWDGSIIYVDKDANGFKNGTTWNDAYTDLQYALDKARELSPNITAIWVAAGTYKPVNDDNVPDYQNKSFELPENVALIGHFGGIGTWETSPNQRNLSNTANVTNLDGHVTNYGVRYVVSANDINEGLIDGFTIKKSDHIGIDLLGAGIHFKNSKNVSAVNCNFSDNYNYGIYAENQSDCNLYNCSFVNNSTGGINMDGNCVAEISSCIFDGTNEGIISSNNTDITVDNCVLKNLTMGINASDSVLTITGCIVEQSSSSAIYAENGSSITLKRNVIRHNVNRYGVELHDTESTTIIDNWIYDNGASNAGIYLYNSLSEPLMRNNTIYGNYDYGIQASQEGADPNIINCIISGNYTSDFYGRTFNKVNYCLLQNTHSGNGNKTGSPGFMNPSNPDDLHISDTSQCKNAGDPNGNYGIEKDIDGDPRIAENRVDIGVDEYYWSKADYNRNQFVNFIDFATFGRAWLQDQNQSVSLDSDNNVDIDDLILFCDDWLWEPVWVKIPWMLLTLDSGFQSESLWSMESEVVSQNVLPLLSRDVIKNQLMLTDINSSISSMSAKLRNNTDKFYQLRPQQPELPPIDNRTINVNAQELLKILDNNWNSGDFQDIMSEETYLSLREYAQQLAKNGK